MDEDPVLSWLDLASVPLARVLEHRTTIAIATGVIIADRRCDPTEAFTVLRRISQHEYRTLHQVATNVISERIDRPPPGPPPAVG